jgi:hypothetical protein
MTCSRCGSSLQEGDRFCPHCGLPVPADAATAGTVDTDAEHIGAEQTGADHIGTEHIDSGHTGADHTGPLPSDLQPTSSYPAAGSPPPPPGDTFPASGDSWPQQPGAQSTGPQQTGPLSPYAQQTGPQNPYAQQTGPQNPYAQQTGQYPPFGQTGPQPGAEPSFTSMIGGQQGPPPPPPGSGAGPSASAPPPRRKRSRLPLVLGIIALVLVLAAGGGVTAYLLTQPSGQDTAQGQQSDEPGDTASDAPSESSKPSSTPTPTPTPTQDATPYAFSSKSGNIRCVMTPGSVICNQKNIKYTAPPQNNAASGVTVGLSTRDRVIWPSTDPSFDGAAAVEYDTAVQHYTWSCTISLSAGITCTSTTDDALSFTMEYNSGVQTTT